MLKHIAKYTNIKTQLLISIISNITFNEYLTLESINYIKNIRKTIKFNKLLINKDIEIPDYITHVKFNNYVCLTKEYKYIKHVVYNSIYMQDINVFPNLKTLEVYDILDYEYDLDCLISYSNELNFCFGKIKYYVFLDKIYKIGNAKNLALLNHKPVVITKYYSELVNNFCKEYNIIYNYIIC